MELRDILKDLPSNDPGIIIKNGIIELTPLYWNFSFITGIIGIFFILCSPYLIEPDYGLVPFLFFIILPIGLYDIVKQLLFYNKIFIDTHKKTVRIIPDKIMSLFIKERTIPWQNIMKVDYFEYGYIVENNRYVLTITVLENSKRTLLISTKYEDNAEKIRVALIKLFLKSP